MVRTAMTPSKCFTDATGSRSTTFTFVADKTTESFQFAQLALNAGRADLQAVRVHLIVSSASRIAPAWCRDRLAIAMGHAFRLIDNDEQHLMAPCAFQIDLNDLDALGLRDTFGDFLDFRDDVRSIHADTNKKVGFRPLPQSDH